MSVTLGQTIVQKRKEQRISQENLYKRIKERGIDIKRDSVRKWERNLEIPDVIQFLALCEIFGFEGVNAMFGLVTEDKNAAFLDIEGRIFARNYLDVLFDSGLYKKIYVEENEKDLNSNDHMGQNPKRHHPFLEQDGHYDIPIPLGRVPENADYSVTISGDGMEPLYLDKQIIWIHEQNTIEEGQLGLFLVDGKLHFKKYHCMDGRIKLMYLNLKYEPIIINPETEFEVLGVIAS